MGLDVSLLLLQFRRNHELRFTVCSQIDQWNKIDFRKTQMDDLKKWNHFDSNMNNYLIEQRKIIYSKNYEIDSRASGLKDYGVQPMMGQVLSHKRSIENILLDQTRGKSLEDRVPAYKKNYTPITQYFKAVVDAKVTK